MIEAYENMNDMEKVKNNFLWIFTVQEIEGLKWNNQMTSGFLMKLEIILMEHPKHQKWKDIHIHQREMKNDQKQRCSFHLHWPIRAEHPSNTVCLPSLNLLQKPVLATFRAKFSGPLSFGTTLHGYSYDFITLAVNHQEPQFQLAPQNHLSLK